MHTAAGPRNYVKINAPPKTDDNGEYKRSDITYQGS